MKYIFTILFTFLTAIGFAQEYKNSTGLRIGQTDGVTYKRFLNDNGAVEFMLGFGGHDKGLRIYSNYQWHFQIPAQFTKNLFLYYGVGGHVGYIRSNLGKEYYENDSTIVTENEEKSYYAVGVDGIIGLEYRIFTVPLTVSIEVKPYFDFYALHYTKWNFWDFGFTVKYIF